MSLSEVPCCGMGLTLTLTLTSICVLMSLLSPAARAAGTVPAPGLTPGLTPYPLPSADQGQLEAPYLHLPVFLHFRKPRVDKRHFAPAQVKSREPLPERVRHVLVPAPRRRLKSRVRKNGPVSVACSTREMRVRVHTAYLGTGAERVHVRLGTCDVSRATEQSVLLAYELQECGTQRQILNKTMVYSNVLHFIPDAADVSGSGMFSIPVQCHFNRFHYSYKIGFVPSVERVKFFKPMKTKGGVTLTACDAQWNRLSPTEGVVIGQPMYFEAETLYVPDDERLFVHFCHVTENSSRVSTPQVKIIDNYGCLIDSKSSSQSRFITSPRRNIVRFTINAFALQGKVQKFLFLHCETSVRGIVPTETSKSCTYNHLEHRWEELYSADSVCSCCDSSCVPEIPTLLRPLTSELGALVKQHPEGKSRNGPTQSTEGIFTPEPEHGILMTESQHKAAVPETTLEHRAVTTERTTILEREHGTITLENTAMPESDGGILTDSDRVEITPESAHSPERDRGLLTPESDHRIVTPESSPILAGEHGIQTPEHKYGALTTEGMHGTVSLETLPTLESEPRTPTADGEHGTLMPDTDQEKVPPHPHGTVSSGTLRPSVEQNTPSPQHKHPELHEPYRIFEEVFGLG